MVPLFYLFSKGIAMEGVLADLKPEKVFYYFEEISKIPRPSGKCDRISDYIASFAKEHDLSYDRDTYGNVLIRKGDQSSSRPTVILQGHMDMVCEKSYDYDAKHDFTKDALKLSVLDDYIFAKGTTLGADDGIAVAFMLAILDDDLLDIPPIEALFTVDEENGMRGAIEFDASKLNGRLLINLDHEVEGEILTCCAGGKRVKCVIPVEHEEVSGIGYNIVVCGLCG